MPAEKEPKPTAAERKALKAAGMVVGTKPIPLGQKSEPVDPADGTTEAPSPRHGPLVEVDGKFKSVLVEGASFDSLLELLDSVD